jgi:FlgN protein
MTTNHQNSDQLKRLAETLWYERRLLEFLLFKLVSANLVLATDDRRFVGPAIAEVDKVVGEVRQAEKDRDIVLVEVAEAMGVSTEDLTLSYLAQHAPSDMRSSFEDHRDGFMDLTNEIETLTRENRRLATLGLDDIAGTLRLAGGSGPATDVQPYTADGRLGPASLRPTRVDQVL